MDSTPIHTPQSTNFKTPATSSSSPSVTESTMPSSLVKDKGEGEGEGEQIVVDDSDIEILEEMNGTPDRVAAGKRRHESEKAGLEKEKEKKKPKLAEATSSSSTPSKPKASGSKEPVVPKPKKDVLAPALVELKGSKLLLKQKVFALNDFPSTTKARLLFQEFFKELPSDQKLEAWPPAQNNFIASLVHESDKTGPNLAKQVKASLLSAVEFIDEDSQESEKGKLSLEARIPIGPLTSLIQSLATRTNYGLEASDLPEGLSTDVPLGLQIWRWEVNDLDLLPPEAEAKLERRKAERVEAKSKCLEILLALPLVERTALFAKGPAVKKELSAKSAASTPAASGSSAPKPKKEKVVKEEKVKPEELEALETKAKLRAAKEAELAAKRASRDQVAAEREEKKLIAEKKKAEKAKLEAEKKEKAEKSAQLIKKQAGILTGFFIKKSASPAPQNALLQAQAGPSKESEFTRVFLPFHIKPNVVMASANKFSKAKLGKTVDVKIDSRPDLTLKQSLLDFLSDVPRHSIPPRNTHPAPLISVRDTIQAINDANVTGDDPSIYWTLLNDRTKVQTKLLKFKEDVRPGYIGTWTKTSEIVKPRTPLAQDTGLLRYDYDSEDEWEEEEEGGDAEELDSNGDLSAEDDSDALSDDWLVDDDEVEFVDGYQEGDEVSMDVDDDDDMIIVETEETRKTKKAAEKEKKAKALKEKRKSIGLLLPLIKGPFWERALGKTVYDPFTSMRIEFLNDAHVGLDPFSFEAAPLGTPIVKKRTPSTAATVSTVVASTSSLPSASAVATKPLAKPAKPSKPIPDFLLSKVVALFHKSTSTKPLLIEATYKALDSKITKSSIDFALKEMAVKVKGEYLVKEEYLAKFSQDSMDIDQ